MLIDLPVQEESKPERLREMHRMFGSCPGHRCGECGYLIAVSYANTYYKCGLRRVTHGPGSDWRKRWPACGKFKSTKAEEGKP